MLQRVFRSPKCSVREVFIVLYSARGAQVSKKQREQKTRLYATLQGKLTSVSGEIGKRKARTRLVNHHVSCTSFRVPARVLPVTSETALLISNKDVLIGETAFRTSSPDPLGRIP